MITGCFLALFLIGMPVEPFQSPELEKLVKQGTALLQNKELEEAASAFSQAIGLAPKNPRLYVARGQSYYFLGQLEAALSDFNQAIALNRNVPLAFLYRGLIHYQRNGLDEALTDLKSAISLNPDLMQARLYSGLAQYRKGQFAEATQACSDILSRDERGPIALCLRGFCHLKSKNLENAYSDLNQAVLFHANYSAAYYGLGLVQKAMGQHGMAKRNLAIACGLNQSLCQSASLSLDQEAKEFQNVEAHPDTSVCFCCELFNKEHKHDEAKVRTLFDARKKIQAQAATSWNTFHGFGFSDRLFESRIRFNNQIVDDGGIRYKPVHYDHGNGIAVADVDGDGLLDLYFVNQMGSNQLWRNKGHGVFEDITAVSGVGMADRISVTAAFADFDNDGDADLFVTTVKMGNVLFENLGRGTFADITKKAGLAYSGHSSGAVFLDYDNDGFLDLFLTNVGVYTNGNLLPEGYYEGLEDAFSGHLISEREERSILYRNEGGFFRDVSKEVRLLDYSWSGDATFSDFNGDGFPELYVANMQGDDHFYWNQDGKLFQDKTLSYFPNTPWGTMGMKFFDFDNDGLMDLFLTDMHSDMSIIADPRSEKLKADMQWSESFLQGGTNNIYGNAFYRNQGDNNFLEVSDRLGVENFWPWGVSVGDLNADGYEDLFVTSSMNYPFRYALNSVLLNHRGTVFFSSELILGVEPRANTVKPWFGLDCSGEDAGHPQCKGRQEKILVWGALGSRSAVIFDLDQDGDLDIVTNEFNGPPQVLVSDLSHRKALHFLEVALQGRKSNRDGLGAWVLVTAGARTYTRYMDGKSGYLSQSRLPLYFGLDNAQSIDKVEVRWPSGKTQTLTRDIVPNSLLTVTEPLEQIKN